MGLIWYLDRNRRKTQFNYLSLRFPILLKPILYLYKWLCSKAYRPLLPSANH